MSNEQNQQQVGVASPCISNCCLREDDVCLGCFRHIDEIVAWSRYSDNQKIQVLQVCAERKRSSINS